MWPHPAVGVSPLRSQHPDLAVGEGHEHLRPMLNRLNAADEAWRADASERSRRLDEFGADLVTATVRLDALLAEPLISKFDHEPNEPIP